MRQDVVDELRTFLRPGDVAIDIGAHTGDSTIPMALAVGPEGRVLALEPNPYVFPILERNASLNAGKTQIVPLNFAATAASGEFEFAYSDAGFCNGGRHDAISRWRHGHAFSLTVKGENLETYMRRAHPDLIARVRYVKVDAEGADLDVLRSLRPILDASRPHVRAEVFGLSPVEQRRALVDVLRALRYDVLRVRDDTHLRGAAVSDADVESGEQFDVFGVPIPGS